MEWVNPAYLPFTDDKGNEDWACPRQDIHERPEEWNAMLLYYGMYLKGHFPDQGAVSDQSNYAIDVFRILDEENQNIEAELNRRKAAKE